jgi:hypothetical protein
VGCALKGIIEEVHCAERSVAPWCCGLGLCGMLDTKLGALWFRLQLPAVAVWFRLRGLAPAERLSPRVPVLAA